MKYFVKNFSYFLLLFLILSACKSDDSGDNLDDPKAANRLALGVSAEDLLSSDIFKSLTVELVYSNAYRPSQETIDNMVTFLNSRINKPDGIQVVETVISDQPGAPFTIEEIRAIEDANRTRYTVGDDIAVYVYFANGNSQNDMGNSVTLGTAYQNTSIVVYEKTLQLVTENNPDGLPILESTTLQHEFGHILGLVNIQDDDIHTNHEDPLHLKHCIVEECLMYFEAINTTRNQIDNFLASRSNASGPIPSFDTMFCIPDLQVKGGK